MPESFYRLLIFILGLALLAGGPSAAAEKGGRELKKSPNAGFQPVYSGGTRDPNGQFMGGTELFVLLRHAGKLYASIGYYWDQPGKDPSPGAQVVVLDRPGGRWRVDHQFDPKQWRASLDSVTFNTDGRGRKLDKPVSMLVAAPYDPTGKIVLYSRDDATGVWTAMPLATNSQIVSVRSLFLHRERVTGVDRIFAGTSPNGVFSGVYDPTVPGRIRWEKAPELTDYERPMGFAECNGDLYLTAKPHLYRRIDGDSPRWEKVYTVRDEMPKFSFGLRGMTTIPNPAGRGEVLLMTLEGNPSRILRIDPALGYQVTVELDVLDFLGQQWGTRPSYGIAAYNGMTPVTDPRTGEKVYLMGLTANSAAPRDEYPKESWTRDGWYLIRRAGGRYELRRITDPALEPMPKLMATRTVVPSPFDHRTLYFAGYDPQTNPSHNTAWIYSASVAAALAPSPPEKGPAGVSIMAIQGTGQFSPWSGRVVETTGVVTLVEPKRAGFWIQDPKGDGDPATSDGLFVSGLGLPVGTAMPAAGDAVRVTGEVEEEQPKGSPLPRTRLRDIRLEVISHHNPLPAPVPLTKLPDLSSQEGIAFWERLEGMRVSIASATVVGPTNSSREIVLAPGDPADSNPERVLMGDATLDPAVTVGAGDKLSLVGVVDYTSGNYKIQPESVKIEARPVPKATSSV